MSGHSKWSSIKHKKGALDAKRGQLFTKLGREITVAARQGGGIDPMMNAGLRIAVQRAKDANMPNANIDRAVQRAVGGGDGEQLVEVTYEGYGPGGTAVLVEAVTDNRNRTVAEVRLRLSRGGGNLAEAGAVAWQFDLRGLVTVRAAGVDPDEVQLAAIEAGALDVSLEDDEVEVVCEPADLEAVRDRLTETGFEVVRSELARVPQSMVELDETTAVQMLRLLERLDELDDVSHVYFNADFPAAVLDEAS